jgi:hypothetical protein
MLLSDIKNQGVSVQIEAIDGDHARIQYHTLDNNTPASNNNYAAIFKPQAVNVIPWGDKPIAVANIIQNGYNGSVEIEDLELTIGTPYIIGYSLSPYNSDKRGNNICSSVYISNIADRSTDKVAVITLGLAELDPLGTYVRIQYTLLKGYDPAKNNNWIGIWDDKDDYLEDAPKTSVQIKKYDSKGAASLNFPIVVGHSYNAYYFCGGWSDNAANIDRKRAAAVLSFSANDKPDV